VVPESYVVLIKAINYVGVINDAVYLFLILCFINFSLLAFIEFYKNPFRLCLVHCVLILHLPGKAFEIAALHTRLQIKNFSDRGDFWLVS